jgi:hypothetical protein
MVCFSFSYRFGGTALLLFFAALSRTGKPVCLWLKLPCCDAKKFSNGRNSVDNLLFLSPSLIKKSANKDRVTITFVPSPSLS